MSLTPSISVRCIDDWRQRGVASPRRRRRAPNGMPLKRPWMTSAGASGVSSQPIRRSRNRLPSPDAWSRPMPDWGATVRARGLPFNHFAVAGRQPCVAWLTESESIADKTSATPAATLVAASPPIRSTSGSRWRAIAGRPPRRRSARGRATGATESRKQSRKLKGWDRLAPRAEPPAARTAAVRRVTAGVS